MSSLDADRMDRGCGGFSLSSSCSATASPPRACQSRNTVVMIVLIAVLRAVWLLLIAAAASAVPAVPASWSAAPVTAAWTTSRVCRDMLTRLSSVPIAAGCWILRVALVRSAGGRRGSAAAARRRGGGARVRRFRVSGEMNHSMARAQQPSVRS